MELLNVVVALKVWGSAWRGQQVQVVCDNSNACIAIQTGRSKDMYVQHCIRELFLFTARYDVELMAVHRPGELMVRADALSRMYTSDAHFRWVHNDPELAAATRREVPAEFFQLVSEL